MGVGSLQWFIECDFQEHYFTLFADAPETHRELARIALFDYVTNNTDRKSGHVLRGDDGRVWGIDHGLCFSADFKLRTVIWDFAGEPIPDALLEDIAPLAESRASRSGRSSSTTTRSPLCSAACSACSAQGCCRLTAPACATRGRWFRTRASAFCDSLSLALPRGATEESPNPLPARHAGWPGTQPRVRRRRHERQK